MNDNNNNKNNNSNNNSDNNNNNNTMKSSHLKLIICKLLIARAVETEQVSGRAQGHLRLDQGGLLVLFGQHGHD